MVFDNIFSSAGQGAGLFSVTANGVKPQPGAGVDFEDSDEGTYDDTTPSLFSSSIHGASTRAKVVQETSPEARAVLGFLGSFIQATQTSAGEQARYAGDPASAAKAAADGMQASSSTVSEHSDLQKDADLADKPSKSDFSKPPKAAKPTAEEPGEPKERTSSK